MRAWNGSAWVPAKAWTGTFWNPLYATRNYLAYSGGTAEAFVGKNGLPWTLLTQFPAATGTYARLGPPAVGATRFRFFRNGSAVQYQFISGDGVADGASVVDSFPLTSSRRVSATFDGTNLRVTYDGQTQVRTITPAPFQETGGLYQLRVESAGSSATFLQRKCPDSEIATYWTTWPS